MNNFKRILEATYKELQDLGYQAKHEKPDGKHASIQGKNYSLGYWKKKLEDAMEAGDKLGMKYAKMEIAKCQSTNKTLEEEK